MVARGIYLKKALKFSKILKFSHCVFKEKDSWNFLKIDNCNINTLSKCGIFLLLEIIVEFLSVFLCCWGAGGGGGGKQHTKQQHQQNINKNNKNPSITYDIMPMVLIIFVYDLKNSNSFQLQWLSQCINPTAGTVCQYLK